MWRAIASPEEHPAQDPTWRPTIYTYFSDRVDILDITALPTTDKEALNYFSVIAKWGEKYNPVWVAAKRPDGTEELLPYVYNKATDSLAERNQENVE